MTKPDEKISDSTWFPHDCDCTADPKLAHLLTKFKALGYAVYFRLLELMHDSPEGSVDLSDDIILLQLSDQLGAPEKELKTVINYAVKPCKLFTLDAFILSSKRVAKNLNHRANIRQIRQEAINKRWSKQAKNGVSHQNNSNTKVLEKNNKSNTFEIQRHTEESRGEYKYSPMLLSSLEKVLLDAKAGTASLERLLGAFVSAYPRSISEQQKKIVAEFFEAEKIEAVFEACANLISDATNTEGQAAYFDDVKTYLS
jgi:hypothetical protein